MRDDELAEGDVFSSHCTWSNIPPLPLNPNTCPPSGARSLGAVDEGIELRYLFSQMIPLQSTFDLANV